MNPSSEQKRLLVHTFQYRLLAVNIVYFFIILLVLATALFLPLMIQLESDTLTWSDKLEVANQFLSLHQRFWPALLLVFVLLAIHSAAISHKLAAPLNHFRNVFKDIARGNLRSRTIVRDGDYLGEDAQIINEMAASLNDRIQDLKDRSAEMERTMSDLHAVVESGSMEKVKKRMEHLRMALDRCNLRIREFKTVDEEPNPKDYGAARDGFQEKRG